jgi:hypothetical protein
MKFVSGPQLAARFTELIQRSRKIDIAVAWISNCPGIQTLRKFAEREDVKVRIVTGVGGYLTDPDVLEKIAKWADLRIHGKATGCLFHAKLYIFSPASEQVVWIGSANLTNSGFTTNVESVLEIRTHDEVADKEFERFWLSKSAVPFSQFDIEAYAAGRTELERTVANTIAASLLPSEMAAGESGDILKASWNTYVAELRNVGMKNSDSFRLSNWLQVLDERQMLIGRQWALDFNKKELELMYGKGLYAPFGRLTAINQGKFLGASGKKRRLQLGAALAEAVKLKSFQEPIVQKIFENMSAIDGCGPALITRLLTLARPDLFLVVNKKSFAGLAKRFQVPVPQKITAKLYAELLRRVQEQPWWKSAEPMAEEDRLLWSYRAALIDPLVYRENASSYDD